MRSAALFAALGLVVPAAVQGAGATPSAWIEGAVNGLPPANERVAASVRAVEATTGRIAAAQSLGSTGRYRLRVAPGSYVVAAGALTRKGRARRATGRLVLVRAGRAARSDLRLPASLSALQAPAGPVVGIGDIGVNGYPVEWYVIGQVLGPLNADGARLVDQTGAVRTAVRQAKRLSTNGRSEPIPFHPLKPRYRITSESGLESNGEASFELRLEDVATGDVLATSGKVSGRPQDPVVPTATSRFVAEMRKAIKRAEASGATGTGPRVKVAIRLRVNCACGPGSAGTVEADPPGLTASRNDTTVRTGDGLRLPAGVTVEVEAQAAPGYYLAGLDGSCAYARPDGTPRLVLPTRGAQGRSFACRIVPVAEASKYDIGAAADFKRCPPNPASYSPADFPFLREDCVGR